MVKSNVVIYKGDIVNSDRGPKYTADVIRGTQISKICTKVMNDHKEECKAECKKEGGGDDDMDEYGTCYMACYGGKGLGTATETIRDYNGNTHDFCKDENKNAIRGNSWVEEAGICKIEDGEGNQKNYRCFMYKDKRFKDSNGILDRALTSGKNTLRTITNLSKSFTEDVRPTGVLVKVKCSVLDTSNPEKPERVLNEDGSAVKTPVIVMPETMVNEIENVYAKEKIIERIGNTKDVKYLEIEDTLSPDNETDNQGPFTNMFNNNNNNNGINIDSDNVYFFLLSILLCYIIFKMIYKK